MSTFVDHARSEAHQRVALFTGEGAYHGASKPKVNPTQPISSEEFAPALEEYVRRGTNDFESFSAMFPNRCDVVRQLVVPSQEQIRKDPVTFCWCPFTQALEQAGPVTGEVLAAMRLQLEGKKRHVYVDSKIQYFEAGDLPVDSCLWHIDGGIAIRDARAKALGYGLLHDMRSRLGGAYPPPTYLAYQSSLHCATEFATKPVTVMLPDCIPSFDLLDQRIRDVDPERMAQPAASIIRFDGLSLHRAMPAQFSGWRLWIRCVETDREVVLEDAVGPCYATVFRPPSV